MVIALMQPTNITFYESATDDDVTIVVDTTDMGAPEFPADDFDEAHKAFKEEPEPCEPYTLCEEHYVSCTPDVPERSAHYLDVHSVCGRFPSGYV